MTLVSEIGDSCPRNLRWPWWQEPSDSCQNSEIASAPDCGDRAVKHRFVNSRSVSDWLSRQVRQSTSVLECFTPLLWHWDEIFTLFWCRWSKFQNGGSCWTKVIQSTEVQSAGNRFRLWGPLISLINRSKDIEDCGLWLIISTESSARIVGVFLL